MIFAGLVIAAISTGLLVGFAMFGVSFPVDPVGRSVALWLDTIAAGVAVFAYSVFFSTPMRILAWPVTIGMLAHALRSWSIVVLSSSAAIGALVGCLVGRADPHASLAPLAHAVRCYRLRFCGVDDSRRLPVQDSKRTCATFWGFACDAGTRQRELSDAMTAVTIILAMSFGLIVQKMEIDRLSTNRSHARLEERRMQMSTTDSHITYPWASTTAALRAVFHGVILSLLYAISYWLITHQLSQTFSVSRDDDLLGGMWAVAATVFVHRYSYDSGIGAAISRMWATSLSFGLCLIYLFLFPFSLAGMVTLIGIGTVTMSLLGRPDKIVATGIMTAVVNVVAVLSAHPPWKQPILRLVDTIVGVGVGVAGVWITSKARSGGPDKLKDEAYKHV